MEKIKKAFTEIHTYDLDLELVNYVTVATAKSEIRNFINGFVNGFESEIPKIITIIVMSHAKENDWYEK